MCQQGDPHSRVPALAGLCRRVGTPPARRGLWNDVTFTDSYLESHA